MGILGRAPTEGRRCARYGHCSHIEPRTVYAN